MPQQGFRAEEALGYAQITLTGATTLRNAGYPVPAGTSLILCQPEAQGVRWRDDKVAPTATVGYPIAVGDELRYTAQASENLQFIGQAAGAILNVVFYR